jgi:hypothetical protein
MHNYKEKYLSNLESIYIMGEKIGKVDPWFLKIQDYITKKIGSFVAFLFLLIAWGAFAAIMVTQHFPEYAAFTVIIPGAAGILSYYNRDIAVLLFGVMLVFILLI